MSYRPRTLPNSFEPRKPTERGARLDLDLKYADVLRLNAELAKGADGKLQVAVLANITVEALKEVLEYTLRSRGIDASVTIGDYDSLAPESVRFRDAGVVVVFYEVAALIDLLPFQLHRMDPGKMAELIESAKRQVALVFAALAQTRVVIFNLLTATPFTLKSQGPTELEDACREINDFVRANAPENVQLVNLDKILARCPAVDAVDLRLFLLSRSLYRVRFLQVYADFIHPLIAVVTGHWKKVLVLDCDGTLWGGTLGEDGLEGIRIYREVQSLVVRLVRHGVLVCLCSKNDASDVTAALDDPGMILRNEHVAVKAVSWADKAAGLAQIARTLELALDSFVFVDDSDLELEWVRRALPAVTAFKVPADYPEYLWLWQSIAALFYKGPDTREDRERTALYKTEFARREQGAQGADLGAYLASLRLVVRLSVNQVEQLPRLAQLTQKTNQFNLAMRRMTLAELKDASTAPDGLAIGIAVCDKFGDYGTTGLILVRQAGNTAHIDNFLLSCRVLGRGVERRAFDGVVQLLRSRGVDSVTGLYRAAPRNGQVRDLYERLGFELLADDGCSRRFRLRLDGYEPCELTCIEVELA